MPHPWFFLIVPVLPVGLLLLLMQRRQILRDKRSRLPLVTFPRPAGWSLQKRLTDREQDAIFHFMLIYFIGCIGYVLSLYDRIGVWALLGVVPASGFYFHRVWSGLDAISNMRTGLLGEQCVGVMLDRLCGPDCRVFHDLEIQEPGKNPWNIDHIAVTREGVFSIETKTRRKLKGRNPEGPQKWEAHFDGKTLALGGFEDDKFLQQSSAQARRLAELLGKLNGTPVNVAPVLVLPGWHVLRRGKGEVTVLNEKELEGLLSKPKALLTPERFRAICAQLEERCQIDFQK